MDPQRNINNLKAKVGVKAKKRSLKPRNLSYAVDIGVWSSESSPENRLTHKFPSGSPSPLEPKHPHAQTYSVNDDQTPIVDLPLLMRHMEAEEELWKLPKTGEMYVTVSADVERIQKRLEYLSESEEATTDMAIEISDGAKILNLINKSTPEIDMAGHKARAGAFLMIQATNMATKATQLLAESKSMLKNPNKSQ